MADTTDSPKVPTRAMTTVELLFTLAPQINISGLLDAEWIQHHKSTVLQERSCNLLRLVSQAGLTVDINTADGKTLTNVSVDESRVKLVYNTSVTAPDNGILEWRPSKYQYTGLVMPVGDYINSRPTLADAQLAGSVAAAIAEQTAKMNVTIPKKPVNKYKREIRGVDINGNRVKLQVDVYDVIDAFSPMPAALQHACKKVLCAGQRGHKDRLQDLRDIIASVEREIENELAKGE